MDVQSILCTHGTCGLIVARVQVLCGYVASDCWRRQCNYIVQITMIYIYISVCGCSFIYLYSSLIDIQVVSGCFCPYQHCCPYAYLYLCSLGFQKWSCWVKDMYSVSFHRYKNLFLEWSSKVRACFFVHHQKKWCFFSHVVFSQCSL